MSEPDRYQQYPHHFYGGEKIKFKKEKQRYTVRCASRRYAICTKPFNAQKTVLYCIVDQWENRRGPEDLVFGAGAETDEQCLEMLVRLLDHESTISYRHDLPLDIETVYGFEDKVITPTAKQQSLNGEEDLEK